MDKYIFKMYHYSFMNVTIHIHECIWYIFTYASMHIFHEYIDTHTLKNVSFINRKIMWNVSILNVSVLPKPLLTLTASAVWRYFVNQYHPKCVWHCWCWMVGLAPKWVRLDPNGTNPGLFQIRFQYIWLDGSSSQMYWNLFWKSPRFVPFETNLINFRLKS